ncbi:hypothetical protein [Neisseria meningitidis]|uniref:hypothetical protein n=1 Tax=Neisseria meningitidis TaxID=487 RepID=UPI0015D5DAFA|nr:hypothetical protein [Neisseria meningitidis]
MPSEAFQTAFAAFGHLKTPSFPRRRESEYIRTETCIPSFPRKRESKETVLSDKFPHRQV